MSDTFYEWLDDHTYKCAADLAKRNPTLAGELAAKYAIESDELRRENQRLQKYEKLVHFIANDYHELSYEKAQWQRDDWKKRCKKLIEEDNEQ